MGVRLAAYTAFAGVAGAFSGLLAFAIQHARVAIANWRLLFIVEGTPSIIFGLVAYAFLPNRPEETRVLDEKERELALERVNRGARADVGRVLNKSEHLPYNIDGERPLTLPQVISTSPLRTGECVQVVFGESGVDPRFQLKGQKPKDEIHGSANELQRLLA